MPANGRCDLIRLLKS